MPRPAAEPADLLARLSARWLGAGAGAAGRPRAWLVGGGLRDRLLGRDSDDLDLAIDGSAIALSRQVATDLGATPVVLDAARDIARLVFSRGPYAGLRLDLSALMGPDIGADLAARDYTVNAIGLALDERGVSAFRAGGDALRASALDPMGGLADLAAGRLRAVSAPNLDQDPVRMLRAARLAAGLGFVLDPTTADMIRDRAGRVGEAAGERLRHEVLRLLASSDPLHGLRVADELGLLAAVLPELAALKDVAQPPPHDRDVWSHSQTALRAMVALQDHVGFSPPSGEARAAPPIGLHLQEEWLAAVAEFGDEIRSDFGAASGQMEGFPRAVWLRLAALLHDVGKAGTIVREEAGGRIRFPEHARVGGALTVEISRRLRIGSAPAGYLERVVAHHMRPLWLADAGHASPLELYRLIRDVGGQAVDLILLCVADNAAKAPPRPGLVVGLASLARGVLGAWYRGQDRLVHPRLPVDGLRIIRDLGLAPGPEVGAILEGLREMVVSGELQADDAQGAMAMARRLRDGLP